MKNEEWRIGFPEKLYEKMKSFCVDMPSAQQIEEFSDGIMRFLFPFRGNTDVSIVEIQDEWHRLQNSLVDLLASMCSLPNEETPENLSKKFFESVPSIHEQLINEASYFLRCDPAAKSIEEVMLCYPGYYAIAIFRLAKELHNLKIPVIPRAMSEFAHSKTGIDIHPGANIGQNFYIDHGTGIVIGETTEIGNNVKIYQGVTLGALYVEKCLQNTKRHPTIEDNVIIYAGSTILGGNTVIGRNTVVGGNVWLTESVEPNSVVYHKAKIVIKNKKK